MYVGMPIAGIIVIRKRFQTPTRLSS